MRGVYRAFLEEGGLSKGSSPLARGLPIRGCSHRNARRIIPACAGFTPAFSRSLKNTPDHPRLRGVYAFLMATQGWCAGSSPLARGLHFQDGVDGRVPGIIPACAGFTEQFPLLISGKKDHPRLRGVYYRRPVRRPMNAGSSPLARGLPGREPVAEPAVGIIPACAGFTAASSLRSRPRWDHPRLRGVYLRSLWVLLSFCGSSPLARGLLPPEEVREMRRRIIPACAGFTRSRGTC